MLIYRPAVYDHAAWLIGQSPARAMGDASLLFEAHLAAQKRYSLSHVVVATDIYGGDSAGWSAAAGRGDPESLADLATCPVVFPAGPQEVIISAAARLRRELPACVQVCVPVTGPFSLAAQLLGFEPLLMGLIDTPQQVEQALDRLLSAQIEYIRAATGIGCPVTFFESAASPPLVRPAAFRAIVQPRLAALMSAARLAGAPELILGGATAPILPLLLELSPALLICDPGNNVSDFLLRCREADVDLRANLEPNLCLRQHRVEAHRRLENLARLAPGDQPLYVATGVTPYDADPEDISSFAELVRQLNA